MVTLFPRQTDARVQTATESKEAPTSKCSTYLLCFAVAMNILRMVKLFGWEPKLSERLSEKRELELQCIKMRQILSLINTNIKWV